MQRETWRVTFGHVVGVIEFEVKACNQANAIDIGEMLLELLVKDPETWECNDACKVS